MNLNISAHHLDLTEALESYVKEKIGKLDGHFDIVSMHLRLVSEPEGKLAKADIQLKGRKLHVEEAHGDMYAAIDKLAAALHTALAKAKDKTGSKRAKKGEDAS